MRHERLTHGEGMLEPMEFERHDPEQAWERLRELDEILSRMPLEQRTVLVLYELEELSGPEISKITGVGEGTVRSRLRLARQAFSRILEERAQLTHPREVGGNP